LLRSCFEAPYNKEKIILTNVFAYIKDNLRKICNSSSRQNRLIYTVKNGAKRLERLCFVGNQLTTLW